MGGRWPCFLGGAVLTCPVIRRPTLSAKEARMEGERLVGASENPSGLRNPARLGPPARAAKTRGWGGYSSRWCPPYLEGQGGAGCGASRATGTHPQARLPWAPPRRTLGWPPLPWPPVLWARAESQATWIPAAKELPGHPGSLLSTSLDCELGGLGHGHLPHLLHLRKLNLPSVCLLRAGAHVRWYHRCLVIRG